MGLLVDSMSDNDNFADLILHSAIYYMRTNQRMKDKCIMLPSKSPIGSEILKSVLEIIKNSTKDNNDGSEEW
ncbi:hypothetical protein GGR21_003353 [Dysgonomonas hofstadii]|uniref:Uncharacterized protein n=1 Tax=Dysgonomonas hofstadii TaxID=637886 RepID=A0A840CPU7_9BACT|nr:hypothetical protein [Dysgonomonas hofstadii]MBB4037436.1 hypothetical protein [Dysgonomonas hofstadii]